MEQNQISDVTLRGKFNGELFGYVDEPSEVNHLILDRPWVDIYFPIERQSSDTLSWTCVLLLQVSHALRWASFVWFSMHKASLINKGINIFLECV